MKMKQFVMPSKQLIDDVIVKQLKAIPDSRGRLMEIMRNDEEVFTKFGQLYITTSYSKVIKAWHYHKIQYDYWCTISGMIKLVLFDLRDDSKTKGMINELYIGIHNMCLVKIPPGIVHGFQTISETESIIINIPSEPYNYKSPDEYKMPADSKDIPFDWYKSIDG